MMLLRLFPVACLLMMLVTTAQAGETKLPAAPQDESLAHYNLHTDIAFKEKTIRSRVSVTLPPEIANQSPTFMLGRRFSIDSIDTGPEADVVIEPADKPIEGLQTIAITYAEGTSEPVTIQFEYSGPANWPTETSYIVIGDDSLEFRLDNMWFPVYHSINLRFTLDAEFTGIPEELVAVSQGDITRDGTTVRVQRRMPDVDVPLVAAPGLKSHTAPGIEVYASDFDYVITKLMTRHALLSAEWYQEWFGPLPFGDVRVVILPVGSGGYARRGYIVSTEAREEVAKMPDFPEDGPARHIAHEFAHAWWSPADPLTDNYWLSESVADYLALRYVEQAFGPEVAAERTERKRETAEAAGPILGQGRPSGDSLYQRGPLLLVALEQRIGRDKLDLVLGRLAPVGPSTTQQFMDELSAVAGDDAVEYFDRIMRSGPGPWEASLPGEG